MATRVTLPPLDHDPASGASRTEVRPPIPVAKVQLENDRGDRDAEAAWLQAAARPGVVQLLSVSSDPTTIVTAHAGARTLRTARLAPLDGLRLMVATADLLAGLHRDGLVHGKLTVDHIIVGSAGPVLCSPDGTIDDPTADVDGMARCMNELSKQWDASGATVAWRQRWDQLATRLADATDPSRSATRAGQALRSVLPDGSPEEPTSAPSPSRRQRGLIAAGVLVTITVSGLVFVADPNAASSSTGPRIIIDGSTYSVGQQGDDVAHLHEPCDPKAPVVLLRPSTGEIFAFDVIGDQAEATAIATTPGAAELRVETSPELGCEIAVARGPAGATPIDTRALTADRLDGR